MADGQMRIEYAPLESLRRHPRNPKLHSIDEIAASIDRHGFASPPIVDERTGLLAVGHGRLEALEARKRRGERPPDRVHLGAGGEWLVPVVRGVSFASDADLEAYLIGDNRLSELGGWDFEAQTTILADLAKVDDGLVGVGYDVSQVEAMVAEVNAGLFHGVDEDPVEEPPKVPTSVPGTIYDLGPHRLLCGDSTQQADVDRVMAGRVADMLFTDPPYGVKYQSYMHAGGTAAGFAPIENDDLDPDELREFLSRAMQVAARVLRPGAAIYVCHANQRRGIYAAFEHALWSAGFAVSAVIVWVKQAASMGWQDYRSRYEPIFYGWKEGGERRRVEDRTETNVWEIARDAAGSYEHPTQKPVALPARAIGNSTVAGETVLDLFGGSGSTLIACARQGRRAVVVEKDPGYCDVIRARWERFVAKSRDHAVVSVA
jgi:DNA modification methylase